MVENDELYHYGVLGMKWGVRRSQDQLDRAAGRYRAKETKKANKKVSRYQKSLVKSIKSHYDIRGNKVDHIVDVGKAMKESKKLDFARTELKALSNMTTSELLTEKSRGRKYALAYLAGPIGSTIATSSVLNKYPDVASAFYEAGYDLNYKSASRVSREMNK